MKTPFGSLSLSRAELSCATHACSTCPLQSRGGTLRGSLIANSPTYMKIRTRRRSSCYTLQKGLRLLYDRPCTKEWTDVYCSMEKAFNAQHWTKPGRLTIYFGSMFSDWKYYYGLYCLCPM